VSNVARAAIAAWLAALAMGLSVAAADDIKPALTVKTRSIEASLTIDPRLKTHPALYASLLSEGRREVDKWRRNADEDRKTDPDFFTGDRRYSFERSYMQASAIGRYVSIDRDDYLYTGGAHPNSDNNSILWDDGAKKRISIRPFLKESEPNGPALTALAKAIRAALAEEKKQRGRHGDIDPETDTELDNVKPDLLKMGAVSLVRSTDPARSSGLNFRFSPYAVGSYAEGPYETFVPWSAFKDHLSPAGIALFGGERPAGDEKND